MRHVVQIAGIHDLAEAELLLECGADYLGFPLGLPDDRADLTEEEARSVIQALGHRAHSVLITYLDDADDIARLARFLGVRWVQLHGPIEVGELERLHRLTPSLQVIKSLIVRGPDASPMLMEVERLAALVDAFITDTYDPETGASGATGKVHDWSVSRSVVAASPRPVILAGGLNPDNVARAIRAVAPAGVDCHTGVEGPDGRKHAGLVREFVDQARRAFHGLH